MKINNKMLHLPPFVSVSWNHVESLHVKGATLVVSLLAGETINIPGLKQEIIESIFTAHAEYLQQEATQRPLARESNDLSKDFPFPLGFPLTQVLPFASSGDGAMQLGLSSLEGVTPVMQHDPSRATSPDIPAVILEKIGAIVKIVMPEGAAETLPAVQNCNCPHCQIARAISGEVIERSICVEEEQVSDVDLAFEPWEIKQIEEKLFVVTDKLDKTEYKVFLGDPIGCTCGEEGCEHIIAVLKS